MFHIGFVSLQVKVIILSALPRQVELYRNTYG